MRRRTLLTTTAGIATGAATLGTATASGVTLTITGTNSPIGGGAFLHVDVRVDNHYDDPINDTVHLYDSSGNHVDFATISADANASGTCTLGFETYETKQDVTFPITVKGCGGQDSTAVTVTAINEDAGHSVAIEKTLDGVTGGEYLEVQFSLGNAEPRKVTDTVHLVDSNGTVLDSGEYTVHGSSTKYSALGYDTYPVRNDVSFPIGVSSSTDSDSATVTVYGTG